MPAFGRLGRRPPRRAGDTEALLERIRRSVIGDDLVVEGPFGPRRLVYADYTASGRALSFVEDFIRHRVLPTYANTHTEATATGRRTTALREQARRTIHRSVNAGDGDVVVFCGTGVTGAVDRLVRVLGLVPGGPRAADPARRPVVFVGPYEHHSNELPWRESDADLVTIREAADGGVDLDDLAAQLRAYTDRPLRIGSFSGRRSSTGGWARSCRSRASASRTSPMTPSSTTSSRRCACWPSTAGGCCRSTASTPSPACGRTTAPRPSGR